MSFSKQIAGFAKRALKKTNQVQRGSVLSLFSRVVARTPVGNTSLWQTKYPPKDYTGGRLRANWQASIGSPKSGEVDSTSASKSYNSINNAVAQYRDDQSIYLANNLQYAEVVENGHSKQAPSGMVKVTVAEFKRIVKGKLK